MSKHTLFAGKVSNRLLNTQVLTLTFEGGQCLDCLLHFIHGLINVEGMQVHLECVADLCIPAHPIHALQQQQQTCMYLPHRQPHSCRKPWGLSLLLYLHC